MSTGTHKGSHSWLEQVAALLRHKDRGRRHRRLVAERLESRVVLSVAPAPVEESDGGLSLEEYMSQEAEMGPVALATDSTAPAAGDPASSDPATTDAYFADYSYAAEGEGDGGGSGSGSGSGSDSGSGSGDGSSSGSGSGSGSDSGSGSGSTSSTAGIDAPPVIESAGIMEYMDTLEIYGSVSDDHGTSGLTVSITGLVEGSGTTDEYGNFTINVPHPEAPGYIYITVTDSAGQVSAVYAIYFSA